MPSNILVSGLGEIGGRGGRVGGFSGLAFRALGLEGAAYSRVRGVLPERAELMKADKSKMHHRATWTTACEERLLELVATHGNKWRVIGEQMNMSEDAVRNKYLRLQNMAESAQDQNDEAVKTPGKKARKLRPIRTMWTSKEDDALLFFVYNFQSCAHNVWVSTASKLPGRNAKACRNRFRRLQSIAKNDRAETDEPRFDVDAFFTADA